MIAEDLDTLGYHRVVFRCDNESSILSLPRAVMLARTSDVVQETSAEGDPQSNGAAESSVNVVKGHVRSIKLAVESASGKFDSPKCQDWRIQATHKPSTLGWNHCCATRKRAIGSLSLMMTSRDECRWVVLCRGVNVVGHQESVQRVAIHEQKEGRRVQYDERSQR